MRSINGLYYARFGQQPFLGILLTSLLVNSNYGKMSRLPFRRCTCGWTYSCCWTQEYQWGSCRAVQQFPDEFAVENKVSWVNVHWKWFVAAREKPNQNARMLPRRTYSSFWKFLSSQLVESLFVALKFFYLYLLCIRSFFHDIPVWLINGFFPPLKSFGEQWGNVAVSRWKLCIRNKNGSSESIEDQFFNCGFK